MPLLLTCTLVITVGGVLLLGQMFRSDDSRLGMAGLALLVAANLMAMVHASLHQ